MTVKRPAQIPNPCDVPVVEWGCGAIGGAGDAAADAVGGVVSGAFEKAAEWFASAAEFLLVEVTTAWLGLDSGSATERNAIASLQEDLIPLTGLVAVLGLIVAATKMALSRRGDDLREAAAGLFRTLLVGSAGVAVLFTALSAGDEFSDWIINQSTEGSFDAQSWFMLEALSPHPGLMFVIGLLGIITGLLQLAFFLIRSAMVVILAGVWQVSAAASMTAAGSQTWKRVTGWLLALVLYKPAAAICYAAAFRLMMHDGEADTELLAVIEGVLILVLAVLALPAMIRLIVPAAASMGGPSTGAALAAGAAVATGAVAMSATGGGAAAGAAGGSGHSGGTPAGEGSGSAGGASPGGGPSGNQAPAGGGPAETGGPDPSGGSPGGGDGDGGDDDGDSPADSATGADTAGDTGPTGGGPGGTTPTGADSAGSGSSDGGPAGEPSGGGGQAASGAMNVAGAAGQAGGSLPGSDDDDGEASPEGAP